MRKKNITMNTFFNPPLTVDAQRVIVHVVLNYILKQKHVNPQNPSLSSSPIYRKAVAEACYLLSEYFLIPDKTVRKTLGISYHIWASYMQRVLFQYEQYKWFEEKIELYADEINDLLTSHDLPKAPLNDEI